MIDLFPAAACAGVLVHTQEGCCHTVCLLTNSAAGTRNWSQSSEESLRALAQHCVTLADVAEDVAAALDHKNPKGGW